MFYRLEFRQTFYNALANTRHVRQVSFSSAKTRTCGVRDSDSFRAFHRPPSAKRILNRSARRVRLRAEIGLVSDRCQPSLDRSATALSLSRFLSPFPGSAAKRSGVSRRRSTGDERRGDADDRPGWSDISRAKHRGETAARDISPRRSPSIIVAIYSRWGPVLVRSAPLSFSFSLYHPRDSFPRQSRAVAIIRGFPAVSGLVSPLPSPPAPRENSVDEPAVSRLPHRHKSSGNYRRRSPG